jgi:hypothetical protein
MCTSVGGIRGGVINQSHMLPVNMHRFWDDKTAIEYGKYGIHTNAIAPRTILTPMVAEAFKEINPF